MSSRRIQCAGRDSLSNTAGRAIHPVDDHVDIAVVIEVAERGAPPGVTDGEEGSGVGREPEPASTQVPPDLGALRVIAVAAELRQIVVYVPVDDQHVRPAVVVEVRERASPAHVGHAVPDDTGAVR